MATSTSRRRQPCKDRKGLGSNGQPRTPKPTGPSFVRQTTNVRAVNPATKSNTLSQRQTPLASLVELATAPLPRPSPRQNHYVSQVALTTDTGISRRQQAENFATAVTQSPFFQALLATANRLRTEQFDIHTDREAWRAVIYTIKVMWNAGKYTDAEAEHHLAQIISSSRQYASRHARAWLGLNEESRSDAHAATDSNPFPFPTDLMGRLIDHFVTVMRPTVNTGDQAQVLVASISANWQETPPPPPEPLRALTEAEAMQESLQMARSTALVGAILTAHGAVDPTLTQLHLCRISVKGDGKCGMT